MGIRTAVVIADGTHGAAMYDSASGWMVGPLWTASDAEEQIDAFLDWMQKEQYIGLAEQIGLTSGDLPSPLLPSSDARNWPDAGLEKIISHWRSTHLGDDGLLLEEPA